MPYELGGVLLFVWSSLFSSCNLFLERSRYSYTSYVHHGKPLPNFDISHAKENIISKHLFTQCFSIIPLF